MKKYDDELLQTIQTGYKRGMQQIMETNFTRVGKKLTNCTIYNT